MMFPHSITVYHYNAHTGAYARQYIQGVYWQGGGEATAANNGEEHKALFSLRKKRLCAPLVRFPCTLTM